MDGIFVRLIPLVAVPGQLTYDHAQKAKAINVINCFQIDSLWKERSHNLSILNIRQSISSTSLVKCFKRLIKIF
tara:strand:- start:101 stop:322 length:222 start_codon:yes stop_codon:yes gene_type:complete